MREQLMCMDGAIQWQFWNFHEGMWNNYMLHETNAGHKVYVISWPTQWQSSCIR